jgi:hypothetical protein
MKTIAYDLSLSLPLAWPINCLMEPSNHFRAAASPPAPTSRGLNLFVLGLADTLPFVAQVLRASVGARVSLESDNRQTRM